MPRQAHGRSLLATGPAKTRKRKPAKGRGLNALETAEREFPEQIKIRQHRLGEAEDDEDAPNTRQDTDERFAKRRKVDNTTDNHDSMNEGSDPDGNPWHVGVDEDDEDSDIDSDEAFGESDEDRFADFTFRGSEQNKDKPPKPKVKKPQSKRLDLDEDELEDEHDGGQELEAEGGSESDSLGEEGVDLAAAWDMDDEDERQEERRAAKKAIPKRTLPQPDPNSSEESAQSASEDESDDDDDPEDDFADFADFDASEDEEDPDTAARLRSFVEGLTPAQQELSRPKPQITIKNLPSKPSSFAIPSAPISAADLMQYVKDPTQRQSLKILQQAEREEPAPYKGGIPGKLAAPLAKRQQDRLDRVAAYDQTKQTLDRWVDTVKQNRRAEHVSFPLRDDTKASASAVKSFQPLSTAQPQNELEERIQEIMQESGFDNANRKDAQGEEAKYEELKEKQLPLEEVQARRRELRMQRELMFREEIRAKRIKKIKSKAYRRVHRKEKDKFAVQERERLAAAGVLNSDEEREKNDRRRAEERMGARHKESRWAKAAKATGQTTWNEDAKTGVSEMASRDEELRRRIEGKDVKGSDESGSDDHSESDYDSDAEDVDEKWNEKLDNLTQVPEARGKLKLADMAFMKKAEAERKVRNDEELKQLRRMNAEDADTESGSDDGAPVRQKYGKPSKKPSEVKMPAAERLEFEERLSDEERANVPEDESSQTAAVPINQRAAPPSFQNGRRRDVASAVTPNDSNAQQLPANGTGRHHLKPQTAPAKTSQDQSVLDDYTSPSESEHDDDVLDAKDRLALDIFAGDDEEDLRKQFQKEKQQLVEEEGDQTIDNSLPGWGSWTGAGISKRQQKIQAANKARFLTTVKGIAPEARKDAKLDRVIVNERRNKKNGKYLAMELPHPFESRQQYERSLRLPIGPEWSTRNHFQDAIKPRILLKQGQVIKPMAKPIA